MPGPQQYTETEMITDESAMDQIRDILRGTPDWGADTLNEIRDLVHLTGRSTEDPEA